MMMGRVVQGLALAVSAVGVGAGCESPEEAGVGYLEQLRRRDAMLAAEEPRRAEMGSSGPTEIRVVTPGRVHVGLYETVEFRADIGGSWVNPFDPEDARLDATILAPDGTEIVVPGFYMVGFERSGSDTGVEVLERTGERGWRVRFTPRMWGKHAVRLVFTDGTGVATAGPLTVEVGGDGRVGAGFVRRSATNERYLEHDDGSLFFPIGLNHAWPDASGTYDYDQTLERTESSGGNTVRVWLGPTFHRLSLETSERIGDHGMLGGLGWYNQEAAWRFDHIVRRAESLGIKVLPVAYSFSGFRSANGPSNWVESPYNAINGGPMERGSEILTDPVARILGKRYLRYMVARWGYSTAVMAWELWNEVTGVDDYDDLASQNWHRDMAAYLKALDPHEHLVTTSTWWTEGTPLLDGLEDIDIVMTHEYNAPDHAIPNYGAGRWKPERYGKPHLTGEFGNQEFDGADSGIYDPETVSVHNVLWAGLMGGSSGGGLYWYWEIGNKAGWHSLFQPVAGFVAELPLHKLDFEPIQARVLGYVDTPSDAGGGPQLLRLPAGAASWNPGEINRPRSIVLDQGGFVEEPWLIPSVLHSESKPSLSNPLTIQGTWPHVGGVAVRVSTVSGWGGGGLRFEVDGQIVAEHTFADGKPEERGEDSAHAGVYEVPVDAGSHEVRISCHTGDWVRVEFELSGVLDANTVPLWTVGMGRNGARTDEVAAMLWFRHRDFCWAGVRAGGERPPVLPTRAEVNGLEAGAYSLEWIDTRDGRPLGATHVEVGSDGVARFVTPVIQESAAAKVRRR